MKKLLLLTVLFSLISATAKADLGSCVVYHAKFYLKNGDVFNGCFEFGSYGEEANLDKNNSNRFCNDKGVFDLFKKKQRENGKVEVYKTLHYVHPRPLHKRKDEYPPDYGFVLEKDKVLLDSNSISKLIFWSAEYSKRYWYTSEVIVGTVGMLDTIRQQRCWNQVIFSTENWETDTITFQGDGIMDGPFGGFALYNYNPQINVAELKRLVSLKFPINYEADLQEFKRKNKVKEGQEWTPKLQRLHEEAVARKLRSVKEWFWKKGILMVAVNGTC